MKRENLSIRTKVLFGSILIGVILFFSGAIAFFEFGRMNRYVASLISDNIISANTVNMMADIGEKYNNKLLLGIGAKNDDLMPDMTPNEDFLSSFETLSQHYTRDEEKLYADSVRYAYAAYIHVVKEMEDVWLGDYGYRRDWYFGRVQKVYAKLRNYLMALSSVSQKALADNYQNLNDSYYRSIMPIVVSVSAGIVLIILFNYFINIYILKPVFKMEKGLRNYRDFKKSYNVKFEYGGDQIQSINELLTDIVEENKSLKRKL